MDPNAALAKIRNLIDSINRASNPDDAIPDYNDALDAFQDLDAWLSQGGFLPVSWDNCPCNGELPK
jgi:hypothetical protein